MKIKNILVGIISDRDLQLTLLLFGAGFLLAVTATHPFLVEDVDEDTVEEGNTEVEVFFPSRGSGSTPMADYDVLQNPTLEVDGHSEQVNASIQNDKQRREKRI